MTSLLVLLALAGWHDSLEEAKRDRTVRRVLGHPYSLNPEGERSGAWFT